MSKQPPRYLQVSTREVTFDNCFPFPGEERMITFSDISIARMFLVSPPGARATTRRIFTYTPHFCFKLRHVSYFRFPRDSGLFPSGTSSYPAPARRRFERLLRYYPCPLYLRKLLTSSYDVRSFTLSQKSTSLSMPLSVWARQSCTIPSIHGLDERFRIDTPPGTQP